MAANLIFERSQSNFMNLIFAFFTSACSLSGLYIALWVSRDYRGRFAYWHELEVLSLEALKLEFDRCIAEVLLFRSQRPRNRRQYHRAQKALVKATVVRERVYHLTGKKPVKSYLRSRRQVLAVVRRCERDSGFLR
ncbi:MAG: hypothetical protein GY883_10705 [Shimia sp.]|nr:hypothetical protein [Shimia sp.]